MQVQQPVMTSLAPNCRYSLSYPCCNRPRPSKDERGQTCTCSYLVTANPVCNGAGAYIEYTNPREHKIQRGE
jgi:hypothetical protein